MRKTFKPMRFWQQLLLVVCVLLGSLAVFSAQEHAYAQGATAPSQATAANDNANFINQIMDKFKNVMKGWTSKLRSFAANLFWTLVSIEVVWTAVSLALKGSELDKWLTTIVNQIFYIGFFAALLLYSDQWAIAIVDSFREAGAAAAIASFKGQGISSEVVPNKEDLINPSNLFLTSFKMAYAIWKTSEQAGLDTLPLSLSALAILVVMMGITAQILLVNAEAYFVIYAGVFMMGFGGSTWTRGSAQNALSYAVAVGAKLFMLELIVALGMNVMNVVVNSSVCNAVGMPINNVGTLQLGHLCEGQAGSIGVLTVMGVAFVFYILAKGVPEMVQSLLTGQIFTRGATMAASEFWPTPLAATKAVATGHPIVPEMALINAAGLGQSRTERAREEPCGAAPQKGYRTGLEDFGEDSSKAPGGNIGAKLSGSSVGGNTGGKPPANAARKKGPPETDKKRSEEKPQTDDEAAAQESKKT